LSAFVFLFTFSFVTFSVFHYVILYLSVLLTRFEAFLSHQLFFLFVYCIYKLSLFLSSADLLYIYLILFYLVFKLFLSFSTSVILYVQGGGKGGREGGIQSSTEGWAWGPWRNTR
jgi:hypothetical protein